MPDHSGWTASSHDEHSANSFGHPPDDSYLISRFVGGIMLSQFGHVPSGVSPISRSPASRMPLSVASWHLVTRPITRREGDKERVTAG